MRAIVMNRLKALIIDWLFICGYLIVLALVMFTVYLAVWQGVPDFSVLQVQALTALTTVVPVTLWFTWKEAQIPFASFGKQEFALQMQYRGNPWRSALIRNLLKFLPWQLAQAGTIHGMFTNFESSAPMLIVMVGLFLALTYVMQVMITPSHRHLPDLVAGARVVNMPE